MNTMEGEQTTAAHRVVARIRADYLSRSFVPDAVIIALASVAFAALGVSRSWQQTSIIAADLGPGMTLVLALPACLLVIAKRRWPIMAFVAAIVLWLIDTTTFGGIGTFIVVLDVLWTAVFLSTPRGRRILLMGMSVLLLLLFGRFLLVGSSVQDALIAVLQLGALFATDFWWAVAVAQARELAELHRQQAADERERATRDLAEAVHAEREMMARELHDVVAGHVSAMSIRAEAALSVPPDEASDRAALRAVRDAGLDAHAAMRSMIAVLRRGEGELVPTPRIDDMPALLDGARRAGLPVRFASNLREDRETPLAPEVGQAIVRVVREALANGIRHSTGGDSSVTIADHGTTVEVVVRTHGGRAPATVGVPEGSGWSLPMLEERVEALGGAFLAGPVEDGWHVQAVLPGEGVRHPIEELS